MRTVLHIGMPKTGSTALQDCLSRSREYLLSCGVLYPENTDDVEFNNHRLLVQPLLDYARLPPSMRRGASGPEDLERWHANFIASVRRQVEKSGPDCLLLSSEHMFRGLASKRAEQVLKDLEAMGAEDVGIVMYARRPSENFLSHCQQDLRTSYKVKQPSVPNYRKTLRRCIELFGRENITLRLFNRAHLVDGDIVTDFCASFLAAEDVRRDQLEDVVRSNESTGAESMEIMRRYRVEFDADRNSEHTRGSNKLVHALYFAEEAVGAPRPRLKPEIADMIDYSSDQVLWLRDRFGLEFPGIDYQRLDREGPVGLPSRDFALEEMVEIDRGVWNAILREIDRTWANGDDRRKAWVAGLLNGTAGA